MSAYLSRLSGVARYVPLALAALLAMGCDDVADAVLETIGLSLSIADVWV